ncbi:MAG: hypothetical protein M1823_002769 [Watsoniomyces obsoletus]|nr:MAG: hypothetical protein M1823_002769 [Watsoniomyces obsoletus]
MCSNLQQNRNWPGHQRRGRGKRSGQSEKRLNTSVPPARPPSSKNVRRSRRIQQRACQSQKRPAPPDEELDAGNPPTERRLSKKVKQAGSNQQRPGQTKKGAAPPNEQLDVGVPPAQPRPSKKAKQSESNGQHPGRKRKEAAPPDEQLDAVVLPIHSDPKRARRSGPLSSIRAARSSASPSDRSERVSPSPPQGARGLSSAQDERATRYWDSLPYIFLTHNALRELDRRNKRNSGSPNFIHPSRPALRPALRPQSVAWRYRASQAAKDHRNRDRDHSDLRGVSLLLKRFPGDD